MTGHSSGDNSDNGKRYDSHQFDRRRNQGNILFVGNLPFQTPWQHVKDFFMAAGKVRYTDLIADRNGRPKGSALVTMVLPEAATRAIEMFNETSFEGRRLIVRKFDDGPRPTLVQRENMPHYGGSTTSNNNNNGSNNNNTNNNNNGGMSTGNQHRFNQGGNVGYNGNGQGTGRANSGYGTNFSTNGSNGNVNGGNSNNGNNRAYRSGGYRVGSGQQGGGGMNDSHHHETSSHHTYNSHDLGAEHLPKPRSQRVSETGRKLFVSNLPFDCTSAALKETFEQVGDVERAEIIMGRNGKSRGMGVVVMGNEREALTAIQEFHGIEMANREMNVRLDAKAV